MRERRRDARPAQLARIDELLDQSERAHVAAIEAMKHGDIAAARHHEALGTTLGTRARTLWDAYARETQP